MSAAKHTPGPWRVYAPPKDVGKTYGIDSDEGTAVVWYGASHSDGIRRFEDARLIAAAPELLEALQSLLAKAEAEGWAYSADERDAARAAIAKATGEAK